MGQAQDIITNPISDNKYQYMAIKFLPTFGRAVSKPKCPNNNRTLPIVIIIMVTIFILFP